MSAVSIPRSSQPWRCPLCHCFAAPGPKGILRHMGTIHALDSNFHVICGLQGCPRSYNNYHSYKKHMYKKHRDVLELDQSLSSQLVDSNPPLEYDNFDCFDDDMSNPPPVTSVRDEKKTSALFLLKTTAVSKVSKSALDDLVSDFSLFLNDKLRTLEDDVTTYLRHKNVEVDSDLLKMFQSPSLTSPFQGLESEFLRKKYYTDHLGMLEPVERKLGQRVLEIKGPHQTRFKKISDYVYEIPLLSSLKQLLSDPFILDEVLRGHQRSDRLLGDYCDGSEYKSHGLFSRDHRALQVIAYYDDVEVCNPLGSKAKKHKLALFYYTLGNISPQYRSAMKCIQLLAITKSTVLQAYGADCILQNFMNDIKQLEEDSGVTFSINGVEYSFNSTLSLVPGDNLASQYLGGFKSLASALRKCRQCMAVDTDMQCQFVSEAFEPRTRDTHTVQCASLGGPLHDHYSTTYGVHRDSILNESRYFHVTEGLVPDVMHDVLEGALEFEVKQLLKLYTSQKVVSLSTLNNAIESFPYSGSDASNKPTSISAKTLGNHDNLLKQSASQMWCLARLLPLYIGEYVPEGDPHWENFLLLLNIVDYCLAPLVCEDWAAYLREIIDVHHKEFKILYPSCRLTPKMHYIIHYPEIMCKYGPLVRFWCMRFESKHNYFKDLAHRVKCFKNIPKTMAQRHQEYVCYYMSGSKDRTPFYLEIKTGKATECIVSSLTYKDVLLGEFSDVSEESAITCLSWVHLNGSTYKHGSIVVLSMADVPTFGIVKDIIVLQTDVYYLVCSLLVTESFSHHFHAFQAHKVHPTKYHLCKPSTLHDTYVLAAYVIPSDPTSMYVPLKYQLIEE